MPNPVIIACPQDAWKLIASNQIFGYLFEMNKKPDKYLYTYRLTGEAAPTLKTEGVPIFQTEEKKLIISMLAVDIYIMAIGNDGSIRYDWTV